MSVNSTPYICKTNDITYHLTVVSVFGATLKLMFAGFILHSKNTSSALYNGLKHVFRIHKKRPKIIVSDYSPLLSRVVDILNEIGDFNGLHVLDPEVFYEQARVALG